MNKHLEVKMRRDFMSMQYNGRSWSAAFVCPACSRNVKKNLNFLGMKSMTCTGLRTYEKRLSDSDVDTLQANLLEICGTFRVAFPNLSALIDLGSIQKDAGHYVGIASDGPVELGTIGHEERLEVYLNQYPTPSRW